MQMSPKTVNYGGKNLGFGDGRFLQKKLGFGVGFRYHNNTICGCLSFELVMMKVMPYDPSHEEVYNTFIMKT